MFLRFMFSDILQYVFFSIIPDLPWTDALQEAARQQRHSHVPAVSRSLPTADAASITTLRTRFM